ncbi:MAG: branched-chain amino acid ABC transporter permease [Sporichthyaceae bacterium]
MPRRLAALLCATIAALIALTIGASSAFAAEDLHGQLRDGDEPVANVRIVVTTEAGAPVGEARTDATGTWAIPLPGPGSYNVTLDTATLPSGVELRDASRDTFLRPVAAGQLKVQQFLLGESAAPSAASQEVNRTAQLIAEGLRFGFILALASVGLSLIYGTTKLTNFAHGELVTYGAIVAWWINVDGGLHLIAAGALAVLICGASGWAQDRFFWGQLRRRGTGLIQMMIVSIGLALLLRYVFLYFYGGDTDAFAEYRGQRAVQLGPLPVALAPRDYWSTGIAAVALVVVLVALNRTKLGKATRAVADNPALAAASGIDVDRVIRVVWIAGAAMAGLAGVLLGVSQQVQFQMGQNILLLMFAAVTLGGLGTAGGAVLGAMIIAVFTQLSTLVVASELKNVGALAVLILVLLLRPQGILGRRERIG